MKTHKVGQDIVFTDRNLAGFTGFHSLPLWLLTVLTLIFFVTESMLLFLGK